MSRKYSEKVKHLLEKFENHSLAILLEKDDEDDDTSKSKEEKTSDDDSESFDFEFPENEEETSGSEIKKDSAKEDNESIASDEIDNESPDEFDDLEAQEDMGPSPAELQNALDNAVDDMYAKVHKTADDIHAVYTPTKQSLAVLDSPNSDRDNYYVEDEYEDSIEQLDYDQYDEEGMHYDDEYVDSYKEEEFDYLKKLRVDNYQRQSIGNFIFESKEDDKVKQKKFDDLELEIEKLEYLTNLMDAKFNRKTAQINEEDLPEILDKSVELINHHDPVEYAYDETIKYITIKANPKLKERLIEDFKVMFNEECKKQGYDTSSITGISTASPTRFKTGVTGVQS